MIPYLFSALTIRAVANVGMQIIIEAKKANTLKFSQIAIGLTQKEIILPFLVVFGVPIFIGVLFGTTALAGVIPGIIISGVSMAFSYSNSGSAWDNTKDHVEIGRYKENG